MTILSPFRRNDLFFLAAVPALYLISRPGSETPEVQDPSQLRLPSPDGKWLAILRQNSLAVSPYPAIPIDQLFIELSGPARDEFGERLSMERFADLVMEFWRGPGGCPKESHVSGTAM